MNLFSLVLVERLFRAGLASLIFSKKSRFEWTGTHSIFAKCAFQVGLVPLVFTKCGVSSGLLPTRSSNKSSFEWDQNCR